MNALNPEDRRRADRNRDLAPPPSPQVCLALQRLSSGCLGLAAALSAVCLAGWVSDIAVLKGLTSSLPPMKVNAALGYLLASASLRVYVRSSPASRLRRSAAALAALAILIGTSTLAEYVFGVKLGIDQLLFSDHSSAHAPYPGRPAANTAVGLVLLGCSLLCWDARVRSWWACNVFAWLAAAVGVLALFGYATGADSLVAFSARQHIALNAAIVLSLLALAILLARPQQGEIAVLASDSAAGAALRRLLPAAIGLPLLLALLVLAGQRAGLFSAKSGAWLFASAVAFTYVALAWLVARTSERAERGASSMRAIVEYADEAIFWMSPAGAIQSWNAAAERLYGRRAKDVIGCPSGILGSPGWDSSRFEGALAGNSVVVDGQATRRDGSIVEVNAALSPIRRGDAVLGVACVVSDITERKAAERELARLAEAAEHGTDAVLSVDLDGRVQHWNHGAEKLYGYGAKEATGHDLRELTLLSDVNEHIERVRGGASAYQYEAQRRRKDGTIIDILTNVVPWRVSGQLVGVTGVTIDITARKRAERAAARLAAIVESSDDAILTYSPEGLIETWNPGAERLCGYAAQEVIGQPRSMLAAPGQGPRPFDDVLAGATARYESRAMRKDASVFDAGVTLSPIRSADGEIVGVCCIWQDITERKQIERKLAEHQATLEAALQSMTDAVFISDVRGRFIHFNEAFTTFYRFHSREQTLSSLNDYPAILEVSMAGGEPAALHEWPVPRALRGEIGTSVEYGLRRKDTGERWVGSYSFAPIRSADGTIVGSVVNGRDITAQRNAQAELELAQRLARLGSWTWNPQAQQATWSAHTYELFSRDPADGPAVGDALLGYVHSADRRLVTEHFKAHSESPTEFEFDFAISSERGEERVLRAVGSHDPSRPGCYVGTFQDVSDQRRAERERVELLQASARAESANRAKSEFLARMSHELRTPLNSIIGFTQLVELDGLTALQSEHVGYVLKAAGHLLELINEVLQLAKIEAGQVTISPEPVALSETVAEALALVGPQAREHGVVLHANTKGLAHDGPVHADRQRLKQVLLNVLSNSCFAVHRPAAAHAC